MNDDICERAKSGPVETTEDPLEADELKVALDNLLSPLKDIDEDEVIDKIWRLILMEHSTFEEFCVALRIHDHRRGTGHLPCGLVWPPKSFAYRCHTCGPPDLSICSDCFKNGYHQNKNHDWKRFQSMHGGTCDCGDDVMDPEGFCGNHGGGGGKSEPADKKQDHEVNEEDEHDFQKLLSMSKVIMPRLIVRLVQFFREEAIQLKFEQKKIDKADKFLEMLNQLSLMGDGMRGVICWVLCDPGVYEKCFEILKPDFSFKDSYEAALKFVPAIKVPERYQDFPCLREKLVHSSFLEELVFWTILFEIPSKMASFLLNLLSHLDFRAPFGRAYVFHYKMFPHLLLHGTNKRHFLRGMNRVSVQIFGAASRSLQLTNEMHLLHVMVFGLQSFLTQIATVNDETKIMSPTHPTIGCLNKGTNVQSTMVVDVTHPAIRNDYYWPLLNELEHVLRHRGVCLKFLEDDDLPRIWFDLVAFLQEMNPSRRELNEHIEYDDDVIYHSTFQFEWCLSSRPTCAMLSHLRVEGTTHLTKKMIAHCLSKLKIWSQNFHTKIQNGDATTSTRLVISFHHPLHRQLAAFLSHAIQHQNLTLTDLLPVNEEGSNFEPELKSICWTLIQFFGGFYEILNGLWARNGYHVKSQAANYVRDFYCSSMIDLDLYLLQVTMMRLPGDIFLDYLFTRFDIDELLQLEIQSDEENEDEDHDDNGMLESLLIFLATMATVRNCMGGGVNDDQRITLEVATQLAIGDCTHSELRSSIENKNLRGQQASSSSSRQTNFDAIFEKLANFRQPTLAPNGNLMEGQYSPKSVVWENHFDPIFLLLRAQSRGEFQTAMNRFEEFAKKSGKIQPSSSASGLWPPYRVPLTPPPPPYSDPRLILLSPKIQTLLFIILHRAVHTSKVTEQVMSLAVHLLELALTVAAAPSSLENFESSDEKDGENELMPSQNSSELPTSTSTCDQNYPPFFTCGTSIFKNLQTEIYASKLGSSVSVQNFKETFISLLLKLHGKLSKNGLQTCAMNHIFDFENHKNCGNDSRIGDGPFFVGKLLQKIATLDPECKTDILCIQKSLIELAKLDHHHQDETNNETTECVQDKRRIEAKERQLKILAEFGKKQKEFLENFETSLPTQNDDDPININPGHKVVTYDCVICNQSSSPTPYEPLGLLTLVKSSNILGHRRPINFQNDQLPLAHSDQQNLAKMSQTHFGQNEVKFLEKYFHQRSFTSSISLDWSSVGGMQVQTCGHYLHSHCLRGYLGSPLSWLSSEYEFQCPLCRQVGNSFLPILPQYEKPPQNQHEEEEGIEQKIYKFLQLPRYKQPDRAEMDLSPFTPLGVDIQIFGRFLLHSNDAAPYRQSDQTKIPVTNRLHLLGSILQANLEQEILKRGGSLVTPQPQSGLSKGSSLGSGRSCLAPLIPALRHQYKELFADEKFEGDAHKIWERIVGIKFDENFENFDHHVDVDVGDSDSTRPPANGDDDDECEVPLFLRDPCAIFLNLVIALPLHVDLVTFTTVVQVVYNFAVAQILTTNSHKFPSHERNHLCSLLLAAQKSTQIDENQETNFDTKNDQSRHTEIGKNFKTFSPIPVNNSKKEACAVAAASKNVPVDSIDKIAQPIVSLEAHIERLLLPFLKIAAFLKHQIFDVDLPCAESCDVEFEFLSKFLQLEPQSSSSKNQNEFDKKLTTLTIDPILVKNVHWLTPQPVKLVKFWCDELCHFTQKFQFADDAAGAGGSLLQIHTILWAQPKLLSLPQGFDTLFNFYETVKCPNCSKIPTTPTLCLLCGALICLAESCCNFNRLQEKKEEGKVDLMEKDKDVVDGVEKDWDICEGTKHAIDCGGGTGIFLNLRSSSTLIIYEERACHWGSLYLDAFGEEDFELRRGKPLYLSKERYQLLEQQWTNQRLGYAAREWYYHNNGL